MRTDQMLAICPLGDARSCCVVTWSILNISRHLAAWGRRGSYVESSRCLVGSTEVDVFNASASVPGWSVPFALAPRYRFFSLVAANILPQVSRIIIVKNGHHRESINSRAFGVRLMQSVVNGTQRSIAVPGGFDPSSDPTFLRKEMWLRWTRAASKVDQQTLITDDWRQNREMWCKGGLAGCDSFSIGLLGKFAVSFMEDSENRLHCSAVAGKITSPVFTCAVCLAVITRLSLHFYVEVES